MNADLYFFTGTGNALTAARIVADQLAGLMYNVRLWQVHRVSPVALNTDTDLCGFLYPTHGFAPAPAMLSFLWRLPRTKKRMPAFLLNTRAGMLFFGLHFPGLSGMALLLPLLILFVKGYSVRGVLPLDMPSNWLSVHPPVSPTRAQKIRERCEPKVRSFARRIASGRLSFWRLLRDLPVDLSVFPISLLYALVGRFFLAKTFIHTDACNGCRLCIKSCPAQAIQDRGGYPYWTLHCESCMRCLNVCPQRAVQSSHLLFSIVLIWSIVSPLYLLFRNEVPGALLQLCDMTLPLPGLMLIYRLLWPHFRSHIVGRLLAYTSLTSLWGRYLAPGLRRKDLLPVAPPDVRADRQHE